MSATSFYIISHRIGKLIRRLEQNLPEPGTDACPVSEERRDEILDELLAEHGASIFRFLDDKAFYFAGLVSSHLDRKVSKAIYFRINRPNDFEYRPSGLYSHAYAQVFKKADNVAVLLERCRLERDFEIDDYHRHIRELEGSIYSGFKRLMRLLHARTHG